ncbi:MAG: hypothetical protein P8Z41_14405, partial [Anaerolineales bacterium]
MITGEHARPTLAKRQRLIVAALRLAQHEPDQPDDEQRWQDVRYQTKDRVPITRFFNLEFEWIFGQIFRRE